MSNKIIFEKFSKRIYEAYSTYNNTYEEKFPKNLVDRYVSYSLLDSLFPRPILTLLGLNYEKNSIDEINFDAITSEIVLIPQMLRDSFAIVDDVVDGDTEKFGNDTLPLSFSKLYGDNSISDIGKNVSLLFGIFLSSNLYEYVNTLQINEMKKNKCCKFISGVVYRTLEAELQGLLYQGKKISSIKKGDILKLYEFKAAEYCYSFPYLVGLLISEAPEDIIYDSEKMLKKIGVLSQIIDDIVGIFPEYIDEPKNTLSDLIELKRTFILLYFYEYNKNSKIELILNKFKINYNEATLIKNEMKKSGFLIKIRMFLIDSLNEIKNEINSLNVGLVTREYMMNLVIERIENNINTIISNITKESQI